jgi:hypothetical protein
MPIIYTPAVFAAEISGLIFILSFIAFVFWARKSLGKSLGPISRGPLPSKRQGVRPFSQNAPLIALLSLVVAILSFITTTILGILELMKH